MKLQNNVDLEKNENNNNYINYTNLKTMSSINEILLNLIPSDLINEVLKFDAHYCCMKKIRERENVEYVFYKSPDTMYSIDNLKIKDRKMITSAGYKNEPIMRIISPYWNCCNHTLGSILCEIMRNENVTNGGMFLKKRKFTKFNPPLE